MALRLDDHWLWDFWFAVDGDDIHVFYLKAPRSLIDPECRHHHARIGHSVSSDATHWTTLEDALPDAEPGSPDDLATWTGSVIATPDGGWRMFYTGISSAESGAVQRILSASSDDLVVWTRDDFVLEAPEAYEKLHSHVTQEQWRDPWVHRDSRTGLWHMLVTARRPSGPLDGRGAIAHATSRDLWRWDVHEPLTPPGLFGQIEVPQYRDLGDRYQILFCVLPEDNSSERLRQGAPRVGGSHVFSSTRAWSDFALEPGPFLVGGTDPALYACRILDLGGKPHLLGWNRYDADRGFGGTLSDPMVIDTAGVRRYSRSGVQGRSRSFDHLTIDKHPNVN